jgi:hypothetical protein
MMVINYSKDFKEECTARIIECLLVLPLSDTERLAWKSSTQKIKWVDSFKVNGLDIPAWD